MISQGPQLSLVALTGIFAIFYSAACTNQRSLTHPQTRAGAAIIQRDLSCPEAAMLNFTTNTTALAIEANPAQYKKVFAISDVHGMSNSLIRLLQSAHIIDSAQNWSAENSLLVVVGDSIDKGNKSVQVIKLWSKLTAQASAAGGRLLHLLGNHEAELLADPCDDKKTAELKKELSSLNMSLEDFLDPHQETGRFLRQMPIAAQIGNWFFAHSGFLPDRNALANIKEVIEPSIQAGNYNIPELVDSDSLLEAKGWWVYDSPERRSVLKLMDTNNISGIVFGHQPKGFNVAGSDAISEDGRLVKIDNGMAPQAGSNSGSLLVFSSPSQMSTTSARPQTIKSGTSTPVALPTEVRGPDSGELDD